MDTGIKPAERLNTVQEYYFSKKLREVAEMNASGKNVINLGVGSPDLPPSDEAIRELNEQARRADAHGYQSYIGIPELREGFAYFYKKWYGVELNPNKEILPLIGSKEGVLHISMTFLNPGDGVLIPNPGYPTYSSVSKLMGARIIPYDLLESNKWQPDFDTLEKMDLSGVKLMWVNYPNMPTGGRATRELFERLVAFGKKHNILICNDNPYSFILNDERLSILSAEGAKEYCIEMNSMSKSHNMPGWRIGMLASSPQIVEWILKAKSNVDSGMFKPVQLAAAKALHAGAEWYDNNNKVYAARRKWAFQIMDTIGCTYDREQVGLFVWARIPDTVTSPEAFADKFLYEANVFLTPGFIFGGNGERYIRISLCAKEEVLEEALERIRKIK
ncbi:MAG: aminotransferase class I/II-fold pyridoxal phosphate-dependent enzyme [Prevotellaceae bacterium]|jgi:aspartate/methionine/tyrosine aminotransferase|nr:aminotransferase class I/II-fold pyridoxal phosphate-dependent enzyme [Prevotellaceae bacterium]